MRRDLRAQIDGLARRLLHRPGRASTCRPSRSKSSGTCRASRSSACAKSGSIELPLQQKVRGGQRHHRRRHRREGASKPPTTAFDAKVEQIGDENFTQFERMVLLQSIDTHWREHLAALDYLRQGIHLRGYAQKQPKQEYKREAFELFGQLLDSVKNEVTKVSS